MLYCSAKQCANHMNFEKIILKTVFEVWYEQRHWNQEAAANIQCQIQQTDQRRITKAHWETTVAKVLLHAGRTEEPRTRGIFSWNNEQ